MITITQFITAEEFAAMSPPVDGSKQELVRGEIVTMSRPKPRHGFVQANIGALLINYTKPNRLGWVFLESGVILEREPDTVRGPDVCFYSITRLPDVPDERASQQPTGLLYPPRVGRRLPHRLSRHSTPLPHRPGASIRPDPDHAAARQAIRHTRYLPHQWCRPLRPERRTATR